MRSQKHTPRPTNRRQFKLWIITSLRELGVTVDDNETYAGLAALLTEFTGLGLITHPKDDECAQSKERFDNRWEDGEVERIRLALHTAAERL